jgi:hypothetical protein
VVLVYAAVDLCTKLCRLDILDENYTMVLCSSKISPIETVDRFFECFNAKDLKSLDMIWDSPCIFIIGNTTNLFTKYRDAVDFEEVINGGWHSSVVNHSEIIFEDLTTAMVQLNFSRLDRNCKEIGRYDVSHLLVNKATGWRIKILFMNDKDGMSGIS